MFEFQLDNNIIDNMKNKILNYLINDRSYNGAVALYHEFGRRASLKKMINVSAETEVIKNTLLEELRVLADIAMEEFRGIMAAPVSPTQAGSMEAGSQTTEVTGEPELELTGDPEPEVTADTEPEVTADPEPEVTGDPDPEVTEDPQREKTKKPKKS